MLSRIDAPVIEVSPIVSGHAIKGPPGKMFDELGFSVNANSVAEHYEGLADWIEIDEADTSLAHIIEETISTVKISKTVMTSIDDKNRLAENVINFIHEI